MAQVKTDKFGTSGFQELYANFASLDQKAFLEYCIKTVNERSVASALKKQEFSTSLRSCNKDRMVKKMTDFFMAGEGNKVYKVGAR